MLSLTALSKRFPTGTLALENISLQLNQGDFLVLLGPSGCGKSTLLRLIAGLESASSGTIAWATAVPIPGDIGFVFQEPTLMPWASALANVSLPLRLRGLPDANERAHKTLAQVGLADFAAARPRTLSGGMRMRVSIARALVSRPKILLMDEPFAALDEFTRHHLQDVCLTLTAELGCTTIFVTHSIYEAAYLASRVVVMSPRPGRIACELPGAPPGPRTRLEPAFMQRVQHITQALTNLHMPA